VLLERAFFAKCQTPFKRWTGLSVASNDYVKAAATEVDPLIQIIEFLTFTFSKIFSEFCSETFRKFRE